jgi:DNA-binding NtrC family response regulator
MGPRPQSPRQLLGPRGSRHAESVTQACDPLQRAVSLARSAVITERDIEACLQSPDPGQVSVPAFAGRTYPELKHHLRSLERDFLGQCLRAHGFRVSDAAKSLGVARTALHNRIKALEIKTQNEGGKNSTGDGRRATGE